MVTAVESGSRSPENGARAAQDVGPFENQMSSMSRKERRGSEASDLRSQYQTSNPDIRLEVQEATQLPSPSPSPPPRSLSPSLAVTDLSTAWTSTLGRPISSGHKYSQSFEKIVHASSNSKESDEAISLLLPISKTLPPHELHDIPEEKVRKRRKSSVVKSNGEVLKLSPAEMEALTSAPESLPVTSPASRRSFSGHASLAPSPVIDEKGSAFETGRSDNEEQRRKVQIPKNSGSEPQRVVSEPHLDVRAPAEQLSSNSIYRQPGFSSRNTSTPTTSARMSSYTKGTPGQTSPKRKPAPSGARPEPLDLNFSATKHSNGTAKSSGVDPPSPIPQSIPLPPMSIPTYLQLELSSSRPSPLYIYRSAASQNTYESSKVKFERLLNFLLLPPQLEQVLYFGSLACLDAWLYTFTILPLRFFKAATILVQWWGQVLAKEARFIIGFVYHGSGRMWHRRRERRGSSDSTSRSRSVSRVRPAASTTPAYQSQPGRTAEASNENGNIEHLKAEMERKSRNGWGRKHRRTKSQPSTLSSYHKADLLQGAVIICSCIILMKLDASRMYHAVRAQAAIKLYVIYNLLEVGRLGSISFCWLTTCRFQTDYFLL